MPASSLWVAGLAVALATTLGCSPAVGTDSETEARLRGEIKALEQRTLELEQRLEEQQTELVKLQSLLDQALEGR
ncbi:MAG: hypothetical protein R3F62_16025 [Planctomycetota bacterium]